MLAGLKISIISLVLFLSPVLSFAEEAQKKSPVTYLASGDAVNENSQSSSKPSPVPLYAEGHIIVKFKRDASSAEIYSANAKVQTVKTKKFNIVRNLHLVKLPSGVSLQKALESYRKDPNVLYAEPDYIVQAVGIPNDPSFSSLWNLRNTGQNGGTSGADIQTPDAWDITTGSKNVVVAVIDTGVDYNHEDIATNMWRNTADCNNNGIDDDGNGYVDDCYGIDTLNKDSDPTDDNGHGTHVAGIIGAVGNNNVGVAGINWNVSIMACKFLDADGSGYTSGAIECLQYVKNMKDRGVNIVATNNSWAGLYNSQALSDAIDAHREREILFVAAAGNEWTNNDILPFFPASYYLPNVISVRATDRYDYGYFNYGKRTVHLGAPGVQILSTTIGNTYSQFDGTSMAAPHVTGVAALLKAQDNNGDWRAIKNLILAGGETISTLTETISGKRLNAFGAATCSNSVILSRLLPIDNTLYRGIGSSIGLSALHINCALPNGEVAITVNPGSQVVILKDDGLGIDQVAGDGIHSGQWTPSVEGTFTLTYPGGDVVTVRVDADLKIGFPVKAFHGSGGYHGGPAIHTLVGNIDEDPKLEIVVTGLAGGPLYAWHSDGSPVSGWPIDNFSSAAYPAMGNLFNNNMSALEVFSGYIDGTLVAISGSGKALSGWPRDGSNYISTPAALADVDGDGLDEIFIGEEDWMLHAYRADGSALPRWPTVRWVGGQERHTPAIADLDGDGDLEIVTASGGGYPGAYLFVYHHDGTSVNGFPVLFDGYADTFPVTGDVDGDGNLEIIVVAKVSGKSGVLIFSADGKVKRSVAITGDIDYGAAPALADLDGDGIPEIVVQTRGAVNVLQGNGSSFPGWPAIFEGASYGPGSSSPVVGDVDGDGLPDIVITNMLDGEKGQVRVYDRNGVIHPRFPKVVDFLGNGAVPAIADIDLDGHNEIVISGSFWDGRAGYFDKVWVYDLGGPSDGPIHWGQFMGGPKHQGYYVTPTSTSGIRVVCPNGGETWTPGSTQTIRWSYAGNPGSFVRIELLKAGIVNSTISSSAAIGSGGSGSYDWSIPSTQTLGSDYKIRITSTSNGSYYDTSDDSFTIVAPPSAVITVLSPDGAETWTAGSTQTIRWTYTENPGPYVKIELLKGGAVSRAIRSIVWKGTGGSGSCNWTIPANQAPGTDYRIRVTSTNGAYTDTSDSDFTIAAPTITVVSPNSGDAWPAGSMQTIRWSYAGNPGAYVRIELLKGNVVNRVIRFLASKGTGGTGSCSWTIPANQTPGADYRIRVRGTNGAYTDISDSDFTIATPTITAVSPNGGETWTAGSIQTIRWSYTGNPGSYVKIELLKGGVVSRTIAWSVLKGSRGSGSRNWKIPLNQAPGSDYSIRVTSTKNNSYSDSSDSNFTISK